MNGLHRTCAETAAVSCGTSHVTTKQCCNHFTSVDNQNALCKATVTHSESITTIAQTQRMALYICHCEALRAHLEMRRWTSVHINSAETRAVKSEFRSCVKSEFRSCVKAEFRSCVRVEVAVLGSPS